MDSLENQRSEGRADERPPDRAGQQATPTGYPWSMPPRLPEFLLQRPRTVPLPPKVYGMTRQFSMRATMLLMALAAVCLAILRSVGAAPETSGIVLLVMIAAAVAQVFLFAGKDPRRASMAGGAVAMAVLLTGAMIFDQQRPLTADRLISNLILGLFNGSIGGAIVGYMTGALVAGVFLLIDKYDEWRPKKTPPAENFNPLGDD